MGTITNYLSEKLRKHLLQIQSYTAPPTLYLALYEGGSELWDYSYSRQPVTFHQPVTNAVSQVAVRNNEVNFGQLDEATGIDGFGVWDDQTDGNELARVTLFPEMDTLIDIDANADFIVPEERIEIAIGGKWSQYLQEQMLRHVFLDEPLTAPAIYVALYGTAPVFDRNGSQLDEPSGGGYARQQHSGSGKWKVSNSKTVNDGAVTFNQATADWSKTIHGAALVDAASGGHLLCWSDTDHTQGDTVNDGDTPEFADEALEVTL